MIYDPAPNEIYVIFDTNVIKSINPDLTTFEFGETYNVFRKFLSGNELNNIKICLPKIVIEELITQYADEYKSSKQKIQDAYEKLLIEVNRVGWNVDLDKTFDIKSREYIDYIKGKCNQYLEMQDEIILIDFPSDKKLSKVIDRSIKKKRPFFKGKYKNKDFSDAGFKDVIFLESVIEFSEVNKGEYYILTRDSFLQESEIGVEMDCYCSVCNIETGKELVELFTKKYEITDMSKYMSFVLSDYYRETIEEVLKCKMTQNTKSLKLIDIEGSTVLENISIVKINESSSEVLVILSEENDFVEIKDVESGEVKYEWGV